MTRADRCYEESPMNRTIVVTLAIGSTLTLAACSSHSSSATPPVGTPTTSAAITGSATAPPASGTPATTASSAASATTTTNSTPSPSAKPTTSVSPTATTATNPTSNRCLTSQLKVTISAGSPGAGQIYSEIRFTNKSSHLCTLAGHPGVSYVAGDDGHQVGASATRDTATVTTVKLAPGGTASALLHEANYQNFDPSTCKAVVVRGLRVYPPGSKAAVYLPRPGKQCSATTLPDPAMTIGVVKAGLGA